MSQGEEDYKCTLSEVNLELAIRELNENPKERLAAVQQFREWILSQPHLKCPTGTEYLLRYLRTAKFSQLRARQILEGFLTMKTDLRNWYDNIDTEDDKIIAFFKTRYCLPLGFNRKNQYVFLYRGAALDVSGKAPYKIDDIFRAVFALNFNHFRDENAFVNGHCFIMDMTGVEMKHMTFWDKDSMSKSWKIFQGNLPGRTKALHYYNCGPVFETIMSMSRPFIKQKFRDRMYIHSNLEKIYQLVPMEILPVEYLPDDYKGPNGGTMDDIVERTLAKLHQPEVRERILYETRPEWGIDLTKKPSDVPSESFRKLNVD